MPNVDLARHVRPQSVEYVRRLFTAPAHAARAAADRLDRRRVLRYPDHGSLVGSVPQRATIALAFFTRLATAAAGTLATDHRVGTARSVKPDHGHAEGEARHDRVCASTSPLQRLGDDDDFEVPQRRGALNPRSAVAPAANCGGCGSLGAAPRAAQLRSDGTLVLPRPCSLPVGIFARYGC